MGIDMIRKRDGREVPFDQDKIEQAIFASFQASGSARGHETSRKLTEEVVRLLENNENISAIPSVEQVQDTVEQVLMRNGFTRTAKSYILYRAERSRVREMNSRLMRTFGDIVFKDASESDIKRENANINGDTAMGAMLKFGSEGAKQYYEKYVMDPRFGQAHMDGDIHIHDMDFYTLTTTCCQIELKSLFKGGFSTGHGYLREPQDITSYAALACIAIQANQNDQHGGQAIVDFDYGMAPGVKKTFIKRYRMNLSRALELLLNDAECDAHANELVAQTKAENLEPTLEENADHRARMAELLTKYVADEQMIARILDFTQRRSEQETDKATYQAMEALIRAMAQGSGTAFLRAMVQGWQCCTLNQPVITLTHDLPVPPVRIDLQEDGLAQLKEEYGVDFAAGTLSAAAKRGLKSNSLDMTLAVTPLMRIKSAVQRRRRKRTDPMPLCVTVCPASLDEEGMHWLRQLTQMQDLALLCYAEGLKLREVAEFHPNVLEYKPRYALPMPTGKPPLFSRAAMLSAARDRVLSSTHYIWMAPDCVRYPLYTGMALPWKRLCGEKIVLASVRNRLDLSMVVVPDKQIKPLMSAIGEQLRALLAAGTIPETEETLWAGIVKEHPDWFEFRALPVEKQLFTFLL